LDWTATDEISVVMLDQFFFQAEDGIRDFHVTGVQTCALPISGCRIIMIHADPTLYFLKKQGRFRRWLTLRLLAKVDAMLHPAHLDRKSTRLNSSHVKISYAVFCLKKKKYFYILSYQDIILINF